MLTYLQGLEVAELKEEDIPMVEFKSERPKAKTKIGDRHMRYIYRMTE